MDPGDVDQRRQDVLAMALHRVGGDGPVFGIDRDRGEGTAAGAATGIDPFVFRLAIFILAIFVGYYVVWQVTPALHTPLMSGANAIHGVILVTDMFGGTPANFPRGKIVMTSPAVLPLVGTVKFRETTKEKLVGFWEEIRNETGMAVSYGERLLGIVDLVQVDQVGPNRHLGRRAVCPRASERQLRRNVAAILRGSEAPEEVFIYMAHWDHLGLDPNREGDQIYNVAKDKGERVSRILKMHANKRERIKVSGAGTIVGIVGLKESGTGDTLCSQDNPVFLEKMMEYTQGVLNGKENKSFFINFITDISPACDCMPNNDAPIVRDIGIVASKDPVAIDQASVDLVNNEHALPGSCLKENKEPGEDKFKGIYPYVDWPIQLDYAEQLGLGTREYELVSVSSD